MLFMVIMSLFMLATLIGQLSNALSNTNVIKAFRTTEMSKLKSWLMRSSALILLGIMNKLAETLMKCHLEKAN